MNKQLISGLFSNVSGVVESKAPLIKLFRITNSMPRHLYFYTPSIVIVCQGSKTSYIKERPITFDSDSYLIVTASIPLECEYRASLDQPLTGLVIDIEPLLLRTVVIEADKVTPYKPKPDEDDLPLVEPTPRTAEINRVLERILLFLEGEDTTELFVKGAIKEIYYHLLKSNQGALLRNTISSGNAAKIMTSLAYISKNFSEPINVDELANLSQMSPTNFYRRFKEQTGFTPLQMIKKTRLSYAKILLDQQLGSVKHIAHQVGYQSQSHFSRDFVKLYGCKPAELLD